jgi:pimeloyl-ACP methyl ester carboxylesterase
MDMPKPLLGVTSHMIKTPRLTQHVLRSGPVNGVPVLFLHGNFASALYWEETMLALPPGFQGVAPDLRGYGWTEDVLIDGTRGMGEWSDDLLELMDALSLPKFHVVGWSMGGGITYELIASAPSRVLSATLIDAVPAYGFGGVKGIDGQPCYDDFAGTGGGVVNPVFIQRIIAGDRGTDDPNSPRNVMNSFYYKPPFRAAREEDFLTGSLMEKTGPTGYPGDFEASPNWPNVRPGVKGPVNAFSSKYGRGLVERFVAATPKPAVLWVRGSDDMIVSDLSLFDFGGLGKLGYVPGWPGDEVFPPQPMVAQVRHILEQYATAGGQFSEHVIPDTAHGPHIEKPAVFAALFHPFIAGSGK